MSDSNYYKQLVDIISSSCCDSIDGLIFCDRIVMRGSVHRSTVHYLDNTIIHGIASNMSKCIANNKEEQNVIDKIKEILFGTNNNDIKEIKNDIKVLKDNMQTFTEVTNLFTDVDKNRNNIDDEIKKVNNRLDKLEQMLMKLLEKD